MQKLHSLLYYLFRIAQRVSLLLAGLSLVIVWIVIINVVFTVGTAQQTVDHKWRDAQTVQEVIDKTTNAVTVKAGLAAGLAGALSLLLLTFRRVRKYEKRLVVDGVVIAAFCLVSAALSNFATTQFIGQYLSEPVSDSVSVITIRA